MTTLNDPHQTWQPELLTVARKDMGIHELLHDGTLNPRVRAMFGHTHYPPENITTTTAWCAAAVCTWLDEAGLQNPHTARAANFLDYGTPVEFADVKEGDILVFRSATLDAGGSGHVGIFAGWEIGPLGKMLVLGGNQLNSVCIRARDQADVVGIRRPLPRAA